MTPREVHTIGGPSREGHGLPGPGPDAAAAPASRQGSPTVFVRWSRAAFGTVCVLLFTLLGAAVASTWDTLLDSLARTPAPTSVTVPPATSLPGPTAAARALAEARRLLDAGQPAAALSALDGVDRSAPEYPFASQLRSHAERMMGGTGATPAAAGWRPDPRSAP